MVATHPGRVMKRDPDGRDDAPIASCQTDIPGAPDPLLLSRLERAMRHYRLQAAHNLLDLALTSLPPPAVLGDVVEPLLRRLEEQGDPGAVHFATSIIEVRLLGHARGWESVDGPLAVLACAPREEYVLRLIGLGLALAERGCRISYLGTGTPVSALRDAARSGGAAVVVLSVAVPRVPPPEMLGLRLLAQDTTVVLCGAAADELAEPLGCQALASDPSRAVEQIVLLAQRQSSEWGDDISSRPV
jgi:hypothetical protein